MTDLRTRLIAAVTAARPVSRLFVAGDGYMSVAIRSDEEAAAIAVDAVIRELTIWIPPIVASAIHSWADSELAAMSHHGGTEGEYEMLKRLNQEAAQIANYATTHEKWNGGITDRNRAQ